MPNLKSVRQRFASLDENTRCILEWWHDGLTEQGYDVPSGKALQEWFKNRKKGVSNAEERIIGTHEPND